MNQRYGWLLIVAALSCGGDAGGGSWSAELTLSEVDVAGTSERSSSKLQAAWTPHAQAVAYELRATEAIGQTTTVAIVAGNGSAEITTLKSATAYTVEISACLDADCASTVSPRDSGQASAATSDEVWQLQGKGASVAELTRIVADGNVKLHAFRYGGDAPAELAGRMQLYYGPMSMTEKGVSVAIGDQPATANVSSVSSFTALTGSAGLIKPASPATLVAEINTPQAIPLSESMGGAVRLMFEASGADNLVRLLTIDSHDGYLGRDFHSGSATVCSQASDYETGGPCEPTILLEGADLPKINNTRQSKIGFPTQDDWRWDGADGTFLVITVGSIAGCSSEQRNSAYALFEGGDFDVQYTDDGCPQLFEDIQSPSPMHLGGAGYKLYFGRPSDQSGKGSSSLPFLGPKLVAYGDGTSTGQLDRLEFEDWEPLSEARGLRFLWPDGSEVDAAVEGFLDDFVFLTPTGDLSFQVMYTAVTAGQQPPFATLAVLVNP